MYGVVCISTLIVGVFLNMKKKLILILFTLTIFGIMCSTTCVSFSFKKYKLKSDEYT